MFYFYFLFKKKNPTSKMDCVTQHIATAEWGSEPGSDLGVTAIPHWKFFTQWEIKL